MKEADSFICQLIDLSHFREEPLNLEDRLEEIATLAAQRLKSRHCSILLLDEEQNPDGKQPRLRVFTYNDPLSLLTYSDITRINEGIASYVAATGCPLIVKDITQSPFVWATYYPKQENPSFMYMPIWIGGQVVGVINVSSPFEKQCFESEDLEVLKLFSLLVSQSIEIFQLKMVLRSKFVERAVIQELMEKQVSSSLSLHPDPTKLAKIVAKSFFRELTQAGFSVNQIIEIATEVLGLLQTNVDKHKKRLHTKDEE